jgi:hypothetical protein
VICGSARYRLTPLVRLVRLRVPQCGYERVRVPGEACERDGERDTLHGLPGCR